MIESHAFVLLPALEFVVPECPEWSGWAQFAHGVGPALRAADARTFAGFPFPDRTTDCIRRSNFSRSEIVDFSPFPCLDGWPAFSHYRTLVFLMETSKKWVPHPPRFSEGGREECPRTQDLICASGSPNHSHDPSRRPGRPALYKRIQPGVAHILAAHPSKGAKDGHRLYGF